MAMHNGVRVRCPRSTVIKMTTADGKIVRVVALNREEKAEIVRVARSLGSFITMIQTFTPKG